MTRPETGRYQNGEGPEFDRPFASPARRRAQRPPRSPLGRLLASTGLLAPLPADLLAPAAALPAIAAKLVLGATDPITVNGAQVILHFDQPLLNVVAPTSAYTVKVGGNSFTPTSTAAEGTNGIRLSVGFTIAPDETVTVEYDKPTSGNHFIQKAALEKADSIPETTATNNNTTNPWSTTAFAASTSETPIAGNVVALCLSGQLGASTGSNAVPIPPASAFTVTVDGTAQAAPGAYNCFSNRGGAGETVLRNRAAAIKSGQTVQVSYASTP